MPTVKELKQKCKAYGIRGYSKLLKHELIISLNSRSRSRIRSRSRSRTRSTRACINQRSALYEEFKDVPPELILKLELNGQVFCFDILALRDYIRMALQDNKPIINPHDLHKRIIPPNKVVKIKKFWNNLVKKHRALVKKTLKEYGYDDKKLSWPRKKKPKPIPKGWRLRWLEGNYMLGGFYVSFPGGNDPGNYYFPNFMDIGMAFTDSKGDRYTIDTGSTSELAMILINDMWERQKLFKKLDKKSLKIIPILKGIISINYWKLNKNNQYTFQTYKVWMKFLENLKNELK